MSFSKPHTSLLLVSSSCFSSYTATFVSLLGIYSLTLLLCLLTNSSGTISSQLSPSTAQLTSSVSSAQQSKVLKPKQSSSSFPIPQSVFQFPQRCHGSQASMYSCDSGHFRGYINTVCIHSQYARYLYPGKWYYSSALTEASQVD